jgi:hypothetical protein
MKFNIHQLNWFTFSTIGLVLAIAMAATAEQEAVAQETVAAIVAELSE